MFRGFSVEAMGDGEETSFDAATLKRAARAQRILYVLMFVCIVLPFLAIWVSGAVQF